MTRDDQKVKVIKTESDYNAAIAHLSKLMDAVQDIEAEMELQALVIQDYERRIMSGESNGQG
jgi:hypothetical protein